jgi:hypothetical protein
MFCVSIAKTRKINCENDIKQSVGEMQWFLMLKQVEHIVTIVIYRNGSVWP